MKRYKITKHVRAERMFQSNAEDILGKIENLTHGNDGYLIDDEDEGALWQPRAVFEKNAMAEETFADRLAVMRAEISAHLKELTRHLKEDGPTMDERKRMYVIIRRAGAYIEDIDRISKFNQMP